MLHTGPISTVTVGPLEIPVYVDPQMKDLGQFKYTDARGLHIRLKKYDPANIQDRMTLFHEVLHVIDDHYGLELGENKIRSLEMTITSLFSENPELYPVPEEAEEE